MEYPSELALLEFFESEPVVLDDVIAYTIVDNLGLSLSVSINIADDSLETTLQLRSHVIATIYDEGMTRLWIDNGVLLAEFVHKDVRSNATICVRPHIRIEWSALRTG